MTTTSRFKPTVTVLTFVAALSFPLIGNAQNNAPLSDNQQLFEDDVIPQSRITPERDRRAADPSVAPVPDEAFADREPNWGSEDDRSRPSRPTRPSDRNTQSPLRAREVRRTVVQTVYEPIPAEELAAAKKLQEAIDLLKSAKDDEARKVATGIIQDQLNSQFDRDVEQREKELVEVEQRVKTLREQLDKRKSLRDDIVGLRLKTIQNDAEGLGFPGEAAAGAVTDIQRGRNQLFEENDNSSTYESDNLKNDPRDLLPPFQADPSYAEPEMGRRSSSLFFGVRPVDEETAFKQLDDQLNQGLVPDDPKAQAEFLLRWAGPLPATDAKMRAIKKWLSQRTDEESDALVDAASKISRVLESELRDLRRVPAGKIPFLEPPADYRRPDDRMSTSDTASRFRTDDGNELFEDVSYPNWERAPGLVGKKMSDDAYASLGRFIQSLKSQRDFNPVTAAHNEIRHKLAQIEANSPSLLSPSKDAQPIVDWAKDRSKENGKLEGFALLRWYYGPERWTEILEAVRKLDPVLAGETDALLAPFQRPDIAPSEHEPSNAWEAFEQINSYNSLESVRDAPKQQADFLMRWASPSPASEARMNGIVMWLGRQSIATSDAILQRFRETNSGEFASEVLRYQNERQDSAKKSFRSNAIGNVPHSYTWARPDVFSEPMPDGEDSRSLIRYLESGVKGGEKIQNFISVFDETVDGLTLRNWFDLSPDQAGQIVKWAKDRSKENGKLEGFALLRWYYPPARWTEILEAVRKLDPALANETDALLAPFIEEKVEEFPALIPEAAEASKDSQNQKFDDDLSLPPTR